LVVGIIFRNFDSHFEHLLEKELSVAARGAAAEIEARQPRLLLDTASVDTGFANRTDEHVELVSPVLADLQETGGACLVLEECSFHQ
jgi:hypothetical protein